jgi:hypothetical protein
LAAQAVGLVSVYPELFSSLSLVWPPEHPPADYEAKYHQQRAAANAARFQAVEPPQIQANSVILQLAIEVLRGGRRTVPARQPGDDAVQLGDV